MNDELEKQIAIILEKALNAAEQTGEFAIEQAPLLLQEFYRWHIASNILGIVFSITLMYLSYRHFKFWGKKEETSHCDTLLLNRYYDVDDVGFFFNTAFNGVAITILIITLIVHIFDLIQIIVAPKIYLIEYFIK